MKTKTSGLALLLLSAGFVLVYIFLWRKPPSSVIPTPTTGPARTVVDQARLSSVDSEPKNWLLHGRDYGEQRFSPLDQITKSNINGLRPAWIIELGPEERGQESTPLVADGIMYVTTSWSRVRALDARTGSEIWRYDPKVPGSWAVNACCDVVNRGAALWGDKIYVGTLDGRVVALNAKTGELVWETFVIDRAERASITGAPRVINGRVFIGAGGGEFGTRGRYTALNAETGAILWRFFSVPGNPETPQENPHLSEALRTWTGEWWKRGGGGAIWDAMSYDTDLDLLYLGTGNGSPWPQSIRSPGGGDNLYVSSILAVRGQTGELIWHYQTTPGDEWGYDAASQLILAELDIAGTPQRVLMQASANGFFYVLDRATGELLSATSYVPTSWASHIDLTTGRPVEMPESRYSKTAKPFVARPGPRGAHSWHPMSFNPKSGLVYIPAQINSALLSVAGAESPSRYRVNSGVRIAASKDMPADSSQLIAWDPARQFSPWTVKRDTPSASGILSTAGEIVFQGTTDGSLEAFDAKSGALLWHLDVGSAIVAAPITYGVDDTQYVTVIAGAGGAQMLEGGPNMQRHVPARNAARIVTFSLKGTATLPEPSPSVAPQPPSPVTEVAQNRKGQELYADNCARCHGLDVINAGPLKSLLESTLLDDEKQWNLVTFAGLLEERGMPGFMAELSAEDVDAIRVYVASRSQELLPKSDQSP